MSSKKQADRLLCRCVGVVLQRTTTSGVSADDGGPGIFSDFLRQNSMCFWNGCLTRSVASLEYKGCVVPNTILISGTDFALEVVRSAWARRVLRPPKGYVINKLGDVGPLDLSSIPQTQFAPLSEAVCVAVGELNSASVPATASSVRRRLEAEFPEMRLPSEEILYGTLGLLIRERKLYHTGEGYFVVSPDTYRHRSVSPVCERQMLMTNEEAIVRMHGGHRAAAIQVDEEDIATASASSTLLRRKDVSCQITQVLPLPDLQNLERSHSLKILRKSRPKSGTGGSFKENKRAGYNTPSELGDSMRDLHKTEKQSMLAKILRRMQSLTEKSSSKHVAFSAQFPPLEWLDTTKFHCHSVATQTLLEKSGPILSLKKLEASTSKLPWSENDREIAHYFYSNGIPKASTIDDPSIHSGRKNVLMRQGVSKYSPTHRYSHGTFTNHSKRRHRHRRSSSESPKIHKNGYQKTDTRTDTTGSKSPTDLSDAKISISSSSGGYTLTQNPKAIVNPRLRFLDPSSKPKLGDHSNTLPYRRNGTLPSAIDHKTTKDLFTYSPKLSKHAYQPEREPKIAKDFAMYSPKITKPILNSSSVAQTPETKKEDNQTTNKPISFVQQEVDKQNNVNSKNSSVYRPLSETRNECNQSSNKPKYSVLKDVDKRNNVNTQKVGHSSTPTTLNDAKLAPSESFSDTSLSFNDGNLGKKDDGFKPLQLNDEDLEPIRKNLGIKPLVLKSFVESPKPQLAFEKTSPKLDKKSPLVKEIKEVIVDNSVSVEFAVENKSPFPTGKKGSNNNNVSTTIVTEETTVTNGKGNSKVVTTVTSITTSLSQGGIKDLEKLSPMDKDMSREKEKVPVNDLNIDTGKEGRIIDCSSSCNIVTEVK